MNSDLEYDGVDNEGKAIYVPKEILKNSHRTEPILKPAIVTAVLAPMVSAAVALGLPLDRQQEAAVLTLSIPVIVLGHALWARRKAWSPSSVYRLFVRLSYDK